MTSITNMWFKFQSNIFKIPIMAKHTFFWQTFFISINFFWNINLSYCSIFALTHIKYCLKKLPVNLLWCQEYIFYCAPMKKKYTLLPEGTDIHIKQHNHWKDVNLCLSLYYYGKVVDELENSTNKEFNFV